MAEDKYFLDTTAIIDYLNGREHVVLLVKDLAYHGYTLGCCCINITELYGGLREKERRAASKLVESLEYFEVNLEIARRAGEYQHKYARKGKTLATSDVIIAATAIANKAILLTANSSHYPMPELKLQALHTRPKS